MCFDRALFANPNCYLSPSAGFIRSFTLALVFFFGGKTVFIHCEEGNLSRVGIFDCVYQIESSGVSVSVTYRSLQALQRCA